MMGLFALARGLGRKHWIILVALAGLLMLSLALKMEKRRHASTRTALSEMTVLRGAEAANHRATKANAAASARAAAFTHEAVKLSIETNWKETSNETENRLQADLRTATDAGTRYRNSHTRAERLRAHTATGTCPRITPGRPDPAAAPPTPTNAGRASELPELADADLRICSENTVKARGWQVFYDGVRSGSKVVEARVQP